MMRFLPFIAISFCPNPPRTIAQSSLGRPPPGHAANEFHNKDRCILRGGFSQRNFLDHRIVDIFEFIESLRTIILAGVVPKLLLLLHQLGRHVIRSCSEPLDDRLGFPAEGQIQYSRSTALLCRSWVASFILPPFGSDPSAGTGYL